MTVVAGGPKCPDRPGHGRDHSGPGGRMPAVGEHGPRRSGGHQFVGECTDTEQRHTGRVSPERFLGWRTSDSDPKVCRWVCTRVCSEKRRRQPGHSQARKAIWGFCRQLPPPPRKAQVRALPAGRAFLSPKRQNLSTTSGCDSHRLRSSLGGRHSAALLTPWHQNGG